MYCIRSVRKDRSVMPMQDCSVPHVTMHAITIAFRPPGTLLIRHPYFLSRILSASVSPNLSSGSPALYMSAKEMSRAEVEPAVKLVVTSGSHGMTTSVWGGWRLLDCCCRPCFCLFLVFFSSLCRPFAPLNAKSARLEVCALYRLRLILVVVSRALGRTLDSMSTTSGAATSSGCCRYAVIC